MRYNCCCLIVTFYGSRSCVCHCSVRNFSVSLQQKLSRKAPVLLYIKFLPTFNNKKYWLKDAWKSYFMLGNLWWFYVCLVNLYTKTRIIMVYYWAKDHDSGPIRNTDPCTPPSWVSVANLLQFSCSFNYLDFCIKIVVKSTYLIYFSFGPSGRIRQSKLKGPWHEVKVENLVSGSL
jgi:hypothetical protein